MAPVIRIDDEVYAALQDKAKAFEDTPNDVMRRWLGLQDGPSNSGKHRRGDLMPLIRSGALRAGSQLVWKRPRKGVVHTAEVTPDGCITIGGVEGKPFKSPSGAANALCGYQVNGWTQWARAADGVLLDKLR
ncbi:DUF4357 domain-containing protein [Streptomonospora halophila]|uniref:DUF4357 domain-containing protein n=1 Tax=Streptomonospora halophila TaxID=427369 RepID=A0ABP9GAP8_9ACTN